MFVKLGCSYVSHGCLTIAKNATPVGNGSMLCCAAYSSGRDSWRLAWERATYQERQAILTGGVANFFLAAAAGIGGTAASVIVVMAR